MEWYTLILIVVNAVALMLFFKSILFSKKPRPAFDNNNLSDFEIQRIVDEEIKRRETYGRKPEEYKRY